MLRLWASIFASTLFSPSVSVTLTCSAPDSCSNMDLSKYTIVKCTGLCACHGTLTFNNATSSLTIMSESSRVICLNSKPVTRIVVQAATNFRLDCNKNAWTCPRWEIEATGVTGRVDVRCSQSSSCNAMQITTVNTTDTAVDCQQTNPCIQLQLHATNVKSSVSWTCSSAEACGSTNAASVNTIFTTGQRADIVCEEGDNSKKPSCFGSWQVLPGSLKPQFACTPNGFVSGPVCGDLVINGNVSVECDRKTANSGLPNYPVCSGVSVDGSNVDIVCRDSSSGSHLDPVCVGVMTLQGAQTKMTCAADKACGTVNTSLTVVFDGLSNSMICPQSASCTTLNLNCTGLCTCAGFCANITYNSRAPTLRPSAAPSMGPTMAPSDTPSDVPSNSPTILPSRAPTQIPTNVPTSVPTRYPVTSGPSNQPTSNPTKNPSLNPTQKPTTKNPTHKPSKLPTKGPSSSPTMKIQVSAAQVNAANQIIRFDIQTQAMIGVIAFLSLFLLIGTLHHWIVGGFVLKHKRMVGYAIMSFDFFTDVLFSFILFEALPDSAVLFAISATTIILPLVLSLIAWPNEVRIWQTERVYFYPQFVVWFDKNSIPLYLLSVVSGSTFGAVQLQNSGLFGLTTFTMNAPRYYVDLYDRKRLYLCVVFENIPQLIVQILWTIRSPSQSGFVLFAAMLTSGLSLIGSIYLGCVKQMRGSALRKYVGMYELTVKEFQRIVDKSLRSVSERFLAEQIKEIIVKDRLSEIGQIYDVHVMDFGVRREVDRVFRVALFVEAFFDSSKDDVMRTMKEMAYSERNLTLLARVLLKSDRGELDVQARGWRCEDLGIETRTFRTDSAEMFSSMLGLGSATPRGEIEEEIEMPHRKSILVTELPTDSETHVEGKVAEPDPITNV